MSVMKEINGYLPLKPSSVGNPDIYLGAKLKENRLPNGLMAWGLSPSKYVIQAVENCQLHLTEKLAGRYSIPARVDNPFLLTMTLPLTFQTFWTLTVLHFISILLV
jgi:hypothetical protein